MIQSASVRLGLSGALLIALSANGGPATAAVPARAPAVQVVVDCRKLEDSAARLTCYDHGVDEMVKAETAGDLVTIDREQGKTLRSQAFGFNFPSLSLFDRGKTAERDDRLAAKVASASRDGAGRWVIRLEDGAVWAQTDDAIVYPDPHSGSAVVIRRASLGSFFMDIDGKPGFRAVRRS